MALLEREAEFAALTTRAEQAVAGQGGLVLVSGEAGAGKTSFVEAFLADRPDDVRVLWGTCDPLTTPRPLGPIYDLSRGLGEHTRAVLDDAEHPYDMFDAVFTDLQSAPRPWWSTTCTGPTRARWTCCASCCDGCGAAPRW